MVGHTFAVHNGKKFIPVYVTREHGRPQARRVRHDADVPRAQRQEGGREDRRPQAEERKRGRTDGSHCASRAICQASPQKVRLVVDLIRGKDVEEAATILRTTKKSAAKPIEKLLKSAVANAENRDQNVDVGKLYVKEAFVDGGPTLKRIRANTMGRAFRILKRQSHVTITLDTRKVALAGPEEPAEPGEPARAESRSAKRTPRRK